MSATSGGGGSVSEGSEAGGSSHSTMSVSDSPSTSFQANLSENVTKITLSEENGALSDVTGSKINLSLDERHQKDGIVNVAFDYEEGGNRVGGGGGGSVGIGIGGVSVGSGIGGGVGGGGSGIGGGVGGGGSGGGDFKSINGSEKKDKVPEAVNLELVNMVPYSNGNGTSYGVPVNGIPMKKDSEQVDMSTPYDEYFVPVNEHKKYMRGEKLYVTKDKRRPTSWRRCLSWIVACTVISVVLIVAILAGTGVILSQEPNLVKEASVGRNFAGSNLKPSVTNNSPPPTAEMYMYVPRSIESEFVIDNLDFDPAFKDSNSTAYQQFAANMEDQLKMLLFDKETLEFGASDVRLKVVNISRDPFKVNYRIGWNYKQGVNNPPEPIKMEDVKKRLVESLARNQGYIDKYHIDREAIKVNHVINTCQMENGGCSHICYYNYITQQFTCTCPTHLVLDGSGKNCVAWTGSSEDDGVPVPSHAGYPETPYESTASPVQEHEFGAHHEHGVYHENNRDGNSKFSSVEHEGHGDEYGDHEPEPEPAPEPTAEPGSNDKVIHGGQVVYSSYDNKNGEPAPEPAAEPSPDGKDHDHSIHSVYESKEPSAEPTPQETDEVNHEHSGHSVFVSKEHEPLAEPTPEPAPEPTADINSEGRDHNRIYGLKDHEPAAEPTPEPAAEPTPEPAPEPTAEHDKAYHHDSSHTYVDKDHEPAAEPTPEPAPEPTVDENKEGHVHHSIYAEKNHEPAAEPTPEPEPAAEPNSESKTHDHDGHFAYGIKNHEPAAEPTPEPEPAAEPNSESKTHDHDGHFAYGIKNHEPAAEPTPEPAPEPTAEHNTEASPHYHDGSSIHMIKEHESSAEPTAEPAPEPTADVNSEGRDHDHMYGFKDHEPSAEPTPEPSTETDSGEKIHGGYESKNQEPTAEPAPEPTAEPVPEPAAEDSKSDDHHSAVYSIHGVKNSEPGTERATEGVTNEHGTHSVYEIKPSSEDGQHFQFDTVQKSESPSPEPSSNTESVDSGSSERIEPSIKDKASESQNSNQESSPLGSIHMTESKTEYPMKFYPAMQNESEEENKSGHHMPHLEDILIRKSNASGQNQNPLQNVELTANGEPVIEEVIIDKSGRNSADQIGHMNNENPNSKGVNNQNIVIVSQTGESSTKGSVEVAEDNEFSDHPEMPTDIPKIIEYSGIHNAGSEKPETEKTEPGPNGSPKGSYETTVRSNEQDPMHSYQHLSGEDKIHHLKDLGSKMGDQVNSSEASVPVTTMHPNVQHEYHTIPVYVEVHTSTDGSPIVEEKSEMPEKNIKDGDMSSDISTKGVAGPTETEHQESENIKGVEQDQVKTQETSTESHHMTTLLSITPEEKVREEHDQDTVVRQIQNENKPNQAESHETTKSPEEISNNIKDELLDNEAFNILIDKEYKNKENIPSEGKDIVSKYPNKSLKTDKKKLKDYPKGEKIDLDKKVEVTSKPGVTPEDFILQKHVNGNENIFDLDYSLQNEHTTKHDGGVTIIDPHSIPGVSFKPHGINNHDLSVLQTISPDFRTETIFPSGAQEFETLKPDSKTKLPENKEGESKLDRDYKFDKEYKYDKQKGSKKKDLKKKVGGKDGKNVELDDGRKYFTDIKDEWDVSQEGKDVTETTMNPETGVRNSGEVTTVHGSSFNRGTDGSETTFQPNIEVRSEESVTEYPKLQSGDEQGNRKATEQSTTEDSSQDNRARTPVDESGHLMIDEPTMKSTFNVSPGTVYDGQLSQSVNQSTPQIVHSGTVFDGISQGTIIEEFPKGESGQNASYVVYKTTHSLPEGVVVNTTKAHPSVIINNQSGNPQDGYIRFANSTQQNFGNGSMFDGNPIHSENTSYVVYKTIHSPPEGVVVNITKAHPTIIIHGQSGNLQDGHIRFADSTIQNSGNGSMFNFTLNHPDGQLFSFTNYTVTYPNGSAVHPTIVVRGQSGALQDGHESRFGNSTFQTFTVHPTQYQNSQVYRIENSSLPGTVFDGNYNPEDDHYHMYTNSSGTWVYTNASTQPIFRIKGESGDFGNSTAYVLDNSTIHKFSGFAEPNSVVFRNSTVFAVENTDGGVREIILEPHDVTSNDTIHFSHQMSPSFVSSGTAYKVNNYFGYISKCAAGQFQCVNGTSKRGSVCISLSSKCDSINDCSDGSDEAGCIENGCPGNFQCSDGTCLKRNLVCNGILDCSDGSDEKNCESWKCEFDEFQCPSGRCIPVVWQCDSKPDCDNHTDEYNCQTSCGNDEYLCPEGWCIPLTYKCNGVKECTNGEDEQLCDCSHDEFKCQTGGCVSMKQVCNGLDDCPDRSDEWDCVKLEPSSNLLKIRSSSGDYEPVCADNWSSRFSDQVCASLGYFSSVPIENENSSITTETSFYVLKNDTTADFNKKIIVNLKKSEGNCSSGKLVEISCQEFSCGSRSMTDSSSVEARLVGGMSATAGQWPSVALLYNIRNLHSCTANVLTPRWVLASYNCLKMGHKNLNEQDWKFYGGSTVFESERENAETRRIVSIIPHPQVKFNQFLFTNDLALVELDQSLQFTSNLGAVCLPEQEMQPRQICVTAGWGMNTPEDKAIRQQLQYLPVPTMNLTECNSTEHYSGFITDDKICAGYNSAQKSLCYNEEGAPLMCVNDRGEWELQGVLSYHSNCGRGSHPSIFSSITPVTDWIKKTIGNNFERKIPAVTNR